MPLAVVVVVVVVPPSCPVVAPQGALVVVPRALALAPPGVPLGAHLNGPNVVPGGTVPGHVWCPGTASASVPGEGHRAPRRGGGGGGRAR